MYQGARTDNMLILSGNIVSGSVSLQDRGMYLVFLKTGGQMFIHSECSNVFDSCIEEWNEK